MIPLENYGVKCMSMGFLVKPENALVWRGPMVMAAVNKLVHGTHWDPLDILVIDLPPGTGDIHLSIAQTINISGIYSICKLDCIFPEELFLSVHTRFFTMFSFTL